MDYLTNPELVRKYVKKLAQPLISLLQGEAEVTYVALKNINLILQKRPTVLEKELKMFFCNFNDPIYIKVEKLDILVRLADLKNIDLILHELKEYANEIDVEFVRRSVRTIGRCAIKLDKAAERCVQALYELLKTKVSYVVQETIIVVKDIFRKYPGKFESLLKELCDNLKILEEPEAKASMIWIIGDYVEIIENADVILNEFMKNFKEEAAVVQLQLLTAYVKLYLTRTEVQDNIMELLRIATEECENPDLRDRYY
jgi:vesicle coat complex subunit